MIDALPSWLRDDGRAAASARADSQLLQGAFNTQRTQQLQSDNIAHDNWIQDAQLSLAQDAHKTQQEAAGVQIETAKSALEDQKQFMADTPALLDYGRKIHNAKSFEELDAIPIPDVKSFKSAKIIQDGKTFQQGEISKLKLQSFGSKVKQEVVEWITQHGGKSPNEQEMLQIRENVASDVAPEAVIKGLGKDATFAAALDRNDAYRGRTDSQKMAAERKAAIDAGINLYPQGESGPRDEEAYVKLLEVQAASKKYKLTTPQVRNVNAILDSDPEFNELPPEQQDSLKARFLANGGKPMALPAAELKDISLQDQLVRSTSKVADIVDAYKDTFGLPNAAKAWVGQYTGNDPRLIEVNQAFAQLKQGQASTIGGKAITPQEMKLVTDAIGTPNDANFRTKLPNYLKAQTELLAAKVDSAKQRGVQFNPNYRDLFKNEWEPNIQDSIQSLDRHGLKLAKQYQFGGATAAPENAPAAEAQVRVVSPDGVVGDLPASKLQEALKRGFKKL